MKPVTDVSGCEYPAALLAAFAVIFAVLGILENLLAIQEAAISPRNS